MDPISLFGIIGHAATSYLQAKNFLINTEMRSEQLRNTILNHEHQLKMFHLQQEYRLRDFSIDHINKLDQETYKSLLKVHEQRLIECKVPPYPLGQWLNYTILPNEPAPYIIICTNTYQGDSPFKNEDVIKPLHKVYQNLKEYNSNHSDLLTITETRQYFNTDEDARNFFIRELQCPTILIYSNFIGSSLTIDMLYAGITNEQNIRNIDSSHPSFTPKTIRLWEMDYTVIHNIKSKKKSNNLNSNGIPENPYQWKKNLDNLIEAFVGIKVQSLIDEYFQNSYIYKPQALKYLNDRKEKYSNSLEWGEFESEVIARHNIITHSQEGFNELHNKLFFNSETVRIQIAVFGRCGCGKSALINSIVQEDIIGLDCFYDQAQSIDFISKPPYGIYEVPTELTKKWIKQAGKPDLHIFIIDGEPLWPEIELFDLVQRDLPHTPIIVFFNKLEEFEYRPKKDLEIVKEKVFLKMRKYVKSDADIIYGSSQLYDRVSDRMIRQDNPILVGKIYNEFLILNKLKN